MRDLKTSWMTRMLGGSGKAASAFDLLEPRLVLAGTPLPALTDLESSNNAVVRLETSFGDVDIELFNSQAPITVANFLNYVTSGRFDETFFHRSAINPNAFVLQGGGFSFDDAAGLDPVSTDAPIVRETTGRSNVARTLAMARTNSINSATSQFFINYIDNLFLDPTSSGNGYAVFGRVIQGWDVVTTIQGLNSLDLTANVAFAGDDATAFSEVPVTDAFDETGGIVTEESLVHIINAEIIKPAAVSGFFAQRVVMPEGYRSGTTIEDLQLINPNDVAAGYQVIAHYEDGSRDTVIASGTIGANSTLRVRLSDFSDSALTILRSDTPYSLVVETALPEVMTTEDVPEGSVQLVGQPIAASINRFDFNATVGEGFFNPAGYSDTQLRTWDFARIERNALSSEFISYVNMSDETATITVTFTTPTGAVTHTREVEAYRRSGLELADLGLPTGVLSARITSTQNIVAFLSDFDLPSTAGTGATSYTPAFGVMGLAGGGTITGGLSDAVIQSNFTNVLSISNPGSTVAAVTMRFWRTGRLSTEDPITQTTVVFANSRQDFVLSPALGIPVGEHFSVTYTSGAANIALQYTSVDDVGRNQSGTKKADGVSTMLSARVAPEVHFTDGQIDPSRTDGTQVEEISIFNPFANSANAFTYTVRYTFSDGTTIDGFAGALGTNGRVDLRTRDSTTAMTKIGSGNEFRRYTISVIGRATTGSTITPAAGLVQFTRTDTAQGRSITSTGTASEFGLGFEDPIFGPGGTPPAP